MIINYTFLFGRKKKIWRHSAWVEKTNQSCNWKWNESALHERDVSVYFSAWAFLTVWKRAGPSWNQWGTDWHQSESLCRPGECESISLWLTASHETLQCFLRVHLSSPPLSFSARSTQGDWGLLLWFNSLRDGRTNALCSVCSICQSKAVGVSIFCSMVKDDILQMRCERGLM